MSIYVNCNVLLYLAFDFESLFVETVECNENFPMSEFVLEILRFFSFRVSRCRLSLLLCIEDGPLVMVRDRCMRLLDIIITLSINIVAVAITTKGAIA